MKTILLVEDNEAIRKGLDYLFMQNDYLLLTCSDIKSATQIINNKHFDLLILDVTLPDGDGFNFYEANKNIINVPVIFLTAKDMEDDIVKGLSLGAVDYIIKPFHNQELLLRINNALRFKNNRIINIKDIEVNLDSMKIMKNDKEIILTSLEYKILALLLEYQNRIVTREMILDKIWDDSGKFVNDNTLTVYIKRIREKLDSDIIKTIKGVGYRIDK